MFSAHAFVTSATASEIESRSTPGIAPIGVRPSRPDSTRNSVGEPSRFRPGFRGSGTILEVMGREPMVTGVQAAECSITATAGARSGSIAFQVIGEDGKPLDHDDSLTDPEQDG